MERWRNRFEDELARAQAAREQGNEGRARVCARRAAGIAVGEFLRRRGLADPGPSAYDRLRMLATLPDVSAQARELASHLTMRVGEDFTLPLPVDLIEEARRLADLLLAHSTSRPA